MDKLKVDKIQVLVILDFLLFLKEQELNLEKKTLYILMLEILFMEVILLIMIKVNLL